MASLLESFRAVVDALERAGVPFAVCGGLAMSIHARPRATIDIDLLAPPESIARLVEAVRPIGFVSREKAPARLSGGRIVMHRLSRIVPDDPDVLMLDVIEAGGDAAAAWADRETVAWEGHSMPVVSRAGLIALKRLRNSAQDQADIAALEEP